MKRSTSAVASMAVRITPTVYAELVRRQGERLKKDPKHRASLADLIAEAVAQTQ